MPQAVKVRLYSVDAYAKGRIEETDCYNILFTGATVEEAEEKAINAVLAYFERRKEELSEEEFAETYGTVVKEPASEHDAHTTQVTIDKGTQYERIYYAEEPYEPNYTVDPEGIDFMYDCDRLN